MIRSLQLKDLLVRDLTFSRHIITGDVTGGLSVGVARLSGRRLEWTMPRLEWSLGCLGWIIVVGIIVGKSRFWCLGLFIVLILTVEIDAEGGCVGPSPFNKSLGHIVELAGWGLGPGGHHLPPDWLVPGS